MPDLLRELARCDEEIARCDEAMQDARLTLQDRMGAGQGWADWSLNRMLIVEEIERMRNAKDVA